MSETSDRYRKLAEQFTARVEAVPDAAWENASPCEGWVARDVVRHLVEWLPAFFFGTWAIDLPPGPTVDEDPVRAWAGVNHAIQTALGDPGVAGQECDTPMGPMTFEQTIEMICTPDVLIHTWDLARAAGLDERLDADEVHRGVEAIAEVDDEMMRNSGHFGPRVEVPAGASEQDRLLAFFGRQP
jgi:uncharacterized protein (TIGR03086 family)